MNFDFAFVLVDDPAYPATDLQKQKIKIIRDTFVLHWPYATRNLSTANVTEPIIFPLPLNEPEYPTPDHRIDWPENINIVRHFVAEYGDIFDFIILYGTPLHYSKEPWTGQYNITVRQNIQGIGMGIYDAGITYNSASKLQSVCFENGIDMYPLTNPLSIKSASNGVTHEVGHRWGAYLKYRKKNAVCDDWLQPDIGIHWNKKLDTKWSVMHGYDWTDNGDGTFTAQPFSTEGHLERYCYYDLYSMGLVTPSEVPPINFIVSDRDPGLIQPGQTISGYAKKITIKSVVAAMGPRTII